MQAHVNWLIYYNGLCQYYYVQASWLEFIPHYVSVNIILCAGIISYSDTVVLRLCRLH